MCFNLETSLITFLVSLYVSYALYKRGQKNDLIIMTFILCYNIVQLGEFLIWLAIKYKNKKLNRFGTLLLTISLISQPMSIMIGSYYDIGSKNKTFGTLLLINVIYFVYNLYEIFKEFYDEKSNLTYTSYPHKKYKNLVWDNNINIQYFFAFILCIISAFILLKPTLLAIICSAYYSFLAIVVYFKSNVIFQSVWCWISSVSSIVIYFINYYVNKYNN